MKLKTRSQLRRVIGKVCSNGLYEMYVLAARADTALMRRRVAKIMNRRRKKQYLYNQKKNSDLEAEIKRVEPLRTGRFRKHIFI